MAGCGTVMVTVHSTVHKLSVSSQLTNTDEYHARISQRSVCIKDDC